jgi:hypothetical protein
LLASLTIASKALAQSTAALVAENKVLQLMLASANEIIKRDKEGGRDSAETCMALEKLCEVCENEIVRARAMHSARRGR